MKEYSQNGLKLNSALKSEVVTLLSGLMSFAVSVITMMLVTLIPADVSLEKYEGILMPDAIKGCAPEPYEMFQYALFIVLYPVAFLLFYRWFSNLKCKSREKALVYYNLANMALPFVILAIMLVAYYLLYGVYYDEFGEMQPSSVIVSVGAAYLLSLIIKSSNKLDRKKQKILFFVIMIFTAVFYLTRALRLDVFHLQTEYHQHHFYAWWYPIYKVLSGKTAGVDFENIYGLYPYLAAPVIKLFGGANAKSFAIYFAICLLSVAAGYFAFIYVFVRNKVLGALAAFGASVYGPLSLIGGGLYAQYHPTRTLFISINLIAISIYHSCKSNKLKFALNLIMPFVLGLGFVWNIESGLVAAVVWAGYHIYIKAQEHKLVSSEVLKETVKYIVSSAFSVVVFFAFAELVTYIRVGKTLTLDAILFGIRVFAGTGFFMWKMQFGIWIGIAAMFVIALTLSLVCLAKNSKQNFDGTTAAGMFVISITAIGAFTYYMGRSYPPNVLGFLVYCVLLSPMFIECYEDKNRVLSGYNKPSETKILSVNRVKSVFCVFIIALCLVMNIQMIVTSFTSSYRYKYYGNNQSIEMFDDTVSKIQRWADEKNDGKIPNMLVYFSAFYDVLLERDAEENVCEQIDWFYLKNAHSYIDFVGEHSDESFVIDEFARDTLMECFPEEWADVEKTFMLDTTEVFVYRHYEKNMLYFYVPTK